MDSLFNNYGFVSSGVLHISPREAYDLCCRGAIIVDVREEYLSNFKKIDVPEILYIPISILPPELPRLSKEIYLIFVDTVGLRSKEAVLILKENGYTNVANMAGGIVDWERDGLPLITNTEERLSGSCVCQLKPRERGKDKRQKD